MENKNRIIILDTLRGILIILVILYHFLYDLNFIFDVNVPLMNTAGINIFRDIFVSMLIFISGICCNLSKNNIKRGIKVLFWGLIISFVTIIFLPEERIIFGILHFFGTAMIIYGVISPVVTAIFNKDHGKTIRLITAAVMFIMFLLTYNIYDYYYPLINRLASSDVFLQYLLFFAGFNTGVISMDYYPVFPWIFLFLSGAFSFYGIQNLRLPDYVYKNYLPFITFIGRHTLIIYICHQPILYGILLLFLG